MKMKTNLNNLQQAQLNMFGYYLTFIGSKVYKIYSDNSKEYVGSVA